MTRALFFIAMSLMILGVTAMIGLSTLALWHTTDALHFACGFRYGQEDIIKAAHLDIPRQEPLPACVEARKAAIKNGFRPPALNEESASR